MKSIFNAILTAVLVLTFMAMIFGVKMAKGESDTSPLERKIMTNMVMQLELLKQSRQETIKPAGLVSQDLPEVLVFLAPFNCPPCNQLKIDVANWDQKYFKIVYPEGEYDVPSYPYVYYKDRAGNGHGQGGWHGKEHLLAWWLDFDKKPRAAQATPVPRARVSANSYNPIRTWPGNLATHLSQDHHASIQGLSQDQMERLHDQLHANDRPNGRPRHRR